MKKREEIDCPCGTYNIKLIIESDDTIDAVQYCPICGVELPELDLGIDDDE